jgi:hypothetical protein
MALDKTISDVKAPIAVSSRQPDVRRDVIPLVQ